jgi:hypothetical protein
MQKPATKFDKASFIGKFLQHLWVICFDRENYQASR